MHLSLRPAEIEHPTFYRAYIDGTPDGDIVEVLDGGHADAVRWLRAVPPAMESHRYADGKWTVREVVGHIMDTERVFAYRLLTIARADTTSLPGFDQDAWMEVAGFDRRSLSELLDEWGTVRAATLALIRTLSDEEAARSGIANGAPITVRALAWIIAGHELHHVRLLRERYGL